MGAPNLGTLLDAAMEAQTQDQADLHFERLVEFMACHHGRSTRRSRIEVLVRENLGYWAAYGPQARRERVERLYKCEHPIFGAVTVYGSPSLDLGIRAGMLLAAAHSAADPKRAKAAAIKTIREAMLAERAGLVP